MLITKPYVNTHAPHSLTRAWLKDACKLLCTLIYSIPVGRIRLEFKTHGIKCGIFGINTCNVQSWTKDTSNFEGKKSWVFCTDRIHVYLNNSAWKRSGISDILHVLNGELSYWLENMSLIF